MPQKISPIPGVAIRALVKDDTAAFRNIRLESLRLYPASFASSISEEERLTEADFATRFAASPPNAIFGAFRIDGASQVLVGILGFHVHSHEKQRHKAGLSGMYVQSAYRRTGIGAALLGRVIEHARNTPDIEAVHLTVAAGNRAVRALYDAAGFIVYGVEKRALRLDTGQYLDEDLMVLDVRPER